MEDVIGQGINNWQADIYGKQKSESDLFYASPEWEALHKACLQRDHYICQVKGCNVRGRKRLSAHHIIPREEGGADHIDNLVALCVVHHNQAHEYIGKYKTRKSIEQMITGCAKKNEDGSKKDVSRGCPYHPGIICWHMVIYGGFGRQYEGMTFQEYEDRQRQDSTVDSG